MNDLISRQAAIDYIKTQRGRTFVESTLEEAIIMMIEEVPSAEPETASNGSITCVKSEKMHDRPTGDLISRADAIDAVEFGITYAKAIDVNAGESKELFKEGNEALKKAVERLKELPPAEPE